jgi:hypothetical protein
MSKLRWSKLWWQDWSDDPALRLCSLAAQGLWMRMLCIAALQHDDLYGFVLVNGKPPTIAQLAKIVGAHHHTVAALLAELERNGVCDMRGGNTYVSRRMLRGKAEHAARKAAGLQGGNPNLKRPSYAKNANGELKLELKPVLNAESEAEAEAEVKGDSPPSLRYPLKNPPKSPRERGDLISFPIRKEGEASDGG